MPRSGRYPERSELVSAPSELTVRGKDAVVLFACGTCGITVNPAVFLADDATRNATARRMATECCDKLCQRCGTPVGKQLHCASCLDLIRGEREALRCGAAQKLDATYVGAVYNHVRDLYYESIDDLRDDCESPDLPPYVYPCTARTLQLNVEDAIDRAIEDLGVDDFRYRSLVDVDELRAFIGAWNLKQTYGVWDPDYTRVIELQATP